MDRGYANISSNTLAPTFTAFAVTALLEEHFPDLVDTTFTAKMESSLDEISSGNLEWLPYLETFYKGKNGLEVKVQKTEGDIVLKLLIRNILFMKLNLLQDIQRLH